MIGIPPNGFRSNLGIAIAGTLYVALVCIVPFFAFVMYFMVDIP